MEEEDKKEGRDRSEKGRREVKRGVLRTVQKENW